jgi:hypothetical protein
MTRLLYRVLGLSLLTLAVVVPAAAARTARVWFPNNRLPLAHATQLGDASPSQRMEIGIGFKDPDAAAEQALMAAQQNPSSQQYQNFLTPAQYEARFAVPQATFDKRAGVAARRRRPGDGQLRRA